MDTITSMFDSGAAKPKGKAARKAIPLNVRAVLWARAAGHCQYTGCNRLLIGDLLSGSPNANLAAIAHIVADSKDGPRGNEILSPRLATDITNLMLLCDVHHRVIDSHDRVHDHPVERLKEMKRLHEERIATVTSIIEDQGCHVVRFAARIGVNESPVAKDAIAVSLLPHRYPVDGGWIDLDVATLELADHEPDFWQVHVKNLRKAFAEKFRGRMERGEIKRLAIFGLAPIPLLFELGRLISDISTAEVRQLHKSPKSWAWQGSEPSIEFTVKRPETAGEIVALKLEVSSGINDDRVTGAIGDIPIWSIAASGAHDDIMRHPDDLAAFAKLFRGTLDEIKAQHGEGVELHVFPSVPLSVAVEAGRSWRSKAHPPLIIHDQNRTLGGFARAHTIAQEA
ncbi:SAVED domain-containing protein [Hansschlegelia beijingensis]